MSKVVVTPIETDNPLRYKVADYYMKGSETHPGIFLLIDKQNMRCFFKINVKFGLVIQYRHCYFHYRGGCEYSSLVKVSDNICNTLSVVNLHLRVKIWLLPTFD